MYEKKKEVMANLLRVEMRSLGHYLALLAEQDRYARDLPAVRPGPRPCRDHGVPACLPDLCAQFLDRQ